MEYGLGILNGFNHHTVISAFGGRSIVAERLPLGRLPPGSFAQRYLPDGYQAGRVGWQRRNGEKWVEG